MSSLSKTCGGGAAVGPSDSHPPCLTLKVIDLCSGLGGATQAFKDRGHEVFTVDIDSFFNPDLCADIRNISPGHFPFKPDFIWASPPCTDFSLAAWNKGKCKDRESDLSIVEACFRIIEEAKSTYWIIENPRACLRHFIGKPTITIKYSDYGCIIAKPTDLWGVFPWFWSRELKRKNLKSFDNAFPHTKNSKIESARVPYGLSLALCLSIEQTLNKGVQF